VFEEGQVETRVPLTTRTGTKDAGELWVSVRKEGGGVSGAETGTKGVVRLLAGPVSIRHLDYLFRMAIWMLPTSPF
jgi:hypothetical protein